MLESNQIKAEKLWKAAQIIADDAEIHTWGEIVALIRSRAEELEPNICERLCGKTLKDAHVNLY